MGMFMLISCLLGTPAHGQTPPRLSRQPDVLEGESCFTQINPGCQSPNPAFTEIVRRSRLCLQLGQRRIQRHRLVSTAG